MTKNALAAAADVADGYSTTVVNKRRGAWTVRVSKPITTTDGQAQRSIFIDVGSIDDLLKSPLLTLGEH
jgi:hypothetical protein